MFSAAYFLLVTRSSQLSHSQNTRCSRKGSGQLNITPIVCLFNFMISAFIVKLAVKYLLSIAERGRLTDLLSLDH